MTASCSSNSELVVNLVVSSLFNVRFVIGNIHTYQILLYMLYSLRQLIGVSRIVYKPENVFHVERRSNLISGLTRFLRFFPKFDRNFAVKLLSFTFVKVNWFYLGWLGGIVVILHTQVQFP